MFRIITATVVTLLACTTAMAEEHHHLGDVAVGRTAAGKLAFELPEKTYFQLPPSGSPFLFGWLDSSPGFDHLGEDEPDEDLYTLLNGAQIKLEIVSIDDGLKLWTSTFSELADAAGERITLGGYNLHTHPLWHLDSDILGPDWTGILNVTLRLVDTGSTHYAPSDMFDLSFGNVAVPEPGTMVLLGLAGAPAILKLRRRKVC